MMASYLCSFSKWTIPSTSSFTATDATIDLSTYVGVATTGAMIGVALSVNHKTDPLYPWVEPVD